MWPKRSELKLQLLRYHARKLAHAPIGTTARSHESLRYLRSKSVPSFHFLLPIKSLITIGGKRQLLRGLLLLSHFIILMQMHSFILVFINISIACSIRTVL